MQPLDPAPLLQPRYRPSSLERAGPPQVSASVLSPHGFHHLNFSLKRTFTVSGKRSLSHPSPGSRSSAQEPDPGSRPLYAGCRTPSNQVPGALIPEGPFAPGSDSTFNYRRVIEGFAFARLPGPYLPGDPPGLWLQRSPPRLLAAAAWSGLKPALGSRLRRACLHLSRSLCTLKSASHS